MKVVHVTFEDFAAGRRGGGERYFNELAMALSKEPTMDIVAYALPRLLSPTRLDLDLGLSTPQSIRQFRSELRSADLIHVHQLNTPGFDHALLATLLGGPPIVLTDHGGGALTPGRAMGRLRNRYIAGIAAVSDWSLNDLDPSGAVGKSSIIFGGGDHVLRVARETRNFEDVDFLFLGRILPHKGLHVLLQSLPQDASLRVAGESRDPSYLADLQPLMAGKNIDFVGAVVDSELADLYRSARYLVLPSVSKYGRTSFARPELLGLVLLESLACGTPVIGSDVGGAGEVLRLAQQTYLKPGDIDVWRQGLKNRLSKPGYVGPNDAFTWESVAGRTVALYTDVLAD